MSKFGAANFNFKFNFNGVEYNFDLNWFCNFYWYTFPLYYFSSSFTYFFINAKQIFHFLQMMEIDPFECYDNFIIFIEYISNTQKKGSTIDLKKELRTVFYTLTNIWQHWLEPTELNVCCKQIWRLACAWYVPECYIQNPFVP